MHTLLILTLLLTSTTTSNDVVVKTKTAIAIAKAKQKPKVEPKQEAQKAIRYAWKVQRIAAPSGYRIYDWGGGNVTVTQPEALKHLKEVHGAYLAEVTKYCDISSMSYRDLQGLHSAIHCAEDGHISDYLIGKWETHCDLITKQCTHTFVFMLP